ncbi:SH3 domain-containing protein [Nodosilinea sp. LEGE 06152]|uniref:SH3 domain-containing protein n=1 Tax=Nodosilinea sp. LEGE 06152 TaxID=2777966 RepID=UPI00187DE862|nr:SH3 domain-containing protein [Nodosilinea sp. LEGE 06152]MBE9160181.1 SH3 domain-containing protein [Nodosilinea sp. LEGE 06152]
MKGFFLGLSKLILGVAIALILLSMAGVATARYFMGRLSVLPPKPLYGDEMPTAPAAAPEVVPETAPEAAPEAAAAPAPPPEPALEPGAYEAVVAQPIGLVMREGPGVEFPQVGGVDDNEAVVVLEEPADQDWVKVRVVSNGQEGWVKAGNTRRTE